MRGRDKAGREEMSTVRERGRKTEMRYKAF